MKPETKEAIEKYLRENIEYNNRKLIESFALLFIEKIFEHPEILALENYHKAEWVREQAEKTWDAAILSSLPIGDPLDTDEAYRNYVRKQQYLDQNFPLRTPPKQD